MGDPPKLRNKYERPKMLWDEDRLSEEKALKKEYGLKNMRELWIASAELKKYRREARRLLSITEQERAVDAQKILNKLARLGVLKEGSSLDDVLSLGVRDVLDRRLQTLVVRKGLARSMAQSRQLITHGFVAIGPRRLSAPSYIVDKEGEQSLHYSKTIDLEIKQPVKAEEKAEEKPEEKAEQKTEEKEAVSA